ncbi:sensor histidine kinase, partial [Planomonospora corallina]
PRVEVVVCGDTAGLPPAVEVAAYRIAHEAVTNVRRHARATTVLVRLSVETDPAGRGELRLTVSDDGVGLPATPRRGVGTASMRERAQEAGGSCVITSRPGGGTEVAVRLPLSPSARDDALRAPGAIGARP